MINEDILNDLDDLESGHISEEDNESGSGAHQGNAVGTSS